MFGNSRSVMAIVVTAQSVKEISGKMCCYLKVADSQAPVVIRNGTCCCVYIAIEEMIQEAWSQMAAHDTNRF